jgi:hypothetical protein
MDYATHGIFVIRHVKHGTRKSAGVMWRGSITTTYNQLIKLLGEPTITRPTSDGKTQRQWVIYFRDEIFTIYDWKVYDINIVTTTLNEFQVAGFTEATEFIERINHYIGELENVNNF